MAVQELVVWEGLCVEVKCRGFGSGGKVLCFRVSVEALARRPS